MKVTATPTESSTVVLEVQITDKEVHTAINEAVSHQQRRVRVPGFRPGKAPRQIVERALGIDRSDPEVPDPIYDEAREHLYQRTVIEALRESRTTMSWSCPASRSGRASRRPSGAVYTVTLPMRPQVELGDYTDYPFEPEVERGRRRPDRPGHRAAARSARVAGAGRGPPRPEGRLRGHRLRGAHRTASPSKVPQADRFPLVIGNERMIPGFEDNLIGMAEGEEKTFTVTFPEDYGEEELAGQGGRVHDQAAGATRAPPAGRGR